MDILVMYHRRCLADAAELAAEMPTTSAKRKREGPLRCAARLV